MVAGRDSTGRLLGYRCAGQPPPPLESDLAARQRRRAQGIVYSTKTRITVRWPAMSRFAADAFSEDGPSRGGGLRRVAAVPGPCGLVNDGNPARSRGQAVRLGRPKAGTSSGSHLGGRRGRCRPLKGRLLEAGPAQRLAVCVEVVDQMNLSRGGAATLRQRSVFVGMLDQIWKIEKTARSRFSDAKVSPCRYGTRTGRAGKAIGGPP